MEAGEYVLSLSEGQRLVRAKTNHDVKLAGDETSESIILNVLTQERSYPILAEESGFHGTIEPEHPHWIVDPIDGSFNFYRGIPFGAISIALWQGDTPLLGVVYDFSHDDLFVGIVGSGAWRNAEMIHVSNISRQGEAVLATGIPVSSLRDERYADRLVEMFRHFGKIRMFGSAALSLAYLACGRVDAYGEDEILLWDVAAGIALVEAAGGHTRHQPTETPHGLEVRCGASESIWTP
jgi:myo-inositol-1(or 4)-monophosphatase